MVVSLHCKAATDTKLAHQGPRGGDLNTRNTVYLGIAGVGNALLLTGDSKYIDAWRNQLNAIRSNAKEIDGVLMYPHNYGEYSGQTGSIVPVQRGQAQWYGQSNHMRGMHTQGVRLRA